METKAKKEATKVVKFDYKSIKSFEDACKHLGIETTLPESAGILEDFSTPVKAAYKLMVIFKAINNGWTPDWGNSNQWKYYPWFGVLSSGFGFSFSNYAYRYTFTSVGSRLCTDSSEKALYIAKTFKEEYKEYFLYKE